MAALAELQEGEDLGLTKHFTREEYIKSRKVRCVVLSMACLTELFKNGNNGRWVRIEGMPDDAVIIDMSEHVRFATQQIVLRVWSDTFTPVEEGSEYIELWCRIKEFKEVPPAKPMGREFI